MVLMLWLAAALQAFGLHVLQHAHDDEPTHRHVVDWAADGGEPLDAIEKLDWFDDKLGPRTPPRIPENALARPTVLPVPAQRAQAACARRDPPRLTGPPLPLRPPTRAPPATALIA